MSAVPRTTSLVGSGGEVERTLGGAIRRVQLAQLQLEFDQRHACRPARLRRIPRPRAGPGRGVRSVRREQVAGRPGRQPLERRRGRQGELVGWRSPGQRSLGMGDGRVRSPATSARPARCVATSAGSRSHSARSRMTRPSCGPVRSRLQRVQLVLDSVEHVARHQRADEGAGQHRPLREHVLAAAVPPSCAASPRHDCRRSRGAASSIRSAARSTSPAANAWRTAASTSPASLVPVAGPSVQHGDVLGPFVEQARLQDVGEQVVVAVPVPVVVQRDERTGCAVPATPAQRGPPLPPGDRVAEGTGQPVQDRGVQQELAQRRPAAGRAPRRPGSPRRSGRRRRTTAMNDVASSRPCSDRAASCSAATQPSVRDSSASTSDVDRPSP